MRATVIKKDYPKLMKHREADYVVLFIVEDGGTVVYTDGEHHSIGDYSEDWLMEEFIDFNGSVILEG